jgi:hypothetical protein
VMQRMHGWRPEDVRDSVRARHGSCVVAKGGRCAHRAAPDGEEPHV